ncbi:hypothetical protein ACSBOX_15725 [Arthrobacter sp. KN11-1C]|uniref:hypothetical protein n=1 Tax=Arthrobacter sp. KN11-1C TaxID=3445774 RepID=UPI003FA0B905
MEAEQSKSRVLHVLRSVMLAGAGAVVWIALSSTAANADSGSTNNNTLLGGAGSTVSNAVHNAGRGLSGVVGDAVPASVASVPAPAVAPVPVSAVQLPALQVPKDVLTELPQLARNVDQLVASTPVISAVVPQGTVGAVTAGVVSPAASAVDGAGSLLDHGLPVVIPGNPIVAPPLQFPDRVVMGDALAGAAAVLDPVAEIPSTLAQDPAASLPGLTGPGGPLGLNGTPPKATVRASDSEDPPAPSSGGTFPPGTPGGSDTASGSAVLSSYPSGAAAAWLESTNMFCPLAGTLVSTAAAGRVPAPVSFDPGSSPD